MVFGDDQDREYRQPHSLCWQYAESGGSGVDVLVTTLVRCLSRGCGNPRGSVVTYTRITRRHFLECLIT